MTVGYNPRAVTDGLVLALDAGNPKSYNAGISTNWTDKVGGNNGTLVGGAHHTDGPFVGAGYVEFDGSGDYLDIASSTDFAFGTGDFTIEVWVYLKANSVGVIYSNEVANSLFLYLDSGNLVVRNYGTTNLFDLTGPSLNTWTHIALSRSGTDLRLFFNGVQQGSTVTNSTDWTQNGTEIGAYNNGTQSLNGYMSNLRVLKGTALYTSNFTPPTKPLTAVTNTVLLTCQGNTIADASSSGHTLTANGNAAANLGYPASAFEFDGSDDYVSSLNLSSYTDLTIQMWIYDTRTSGERDILTYNGTGSGGAFTFNGSNFRTDGNGSPGRIISGVGNPPANQWYQFTYVKNGSLYINTNEYSSSSGSENVYGVLDIGRTRTDINNFLNGKVAIVRVYNRALTAAEILQNYNALRGRYGI